MTPSPPPHAPVARAIRSTQTTYSIRFPLHSCRIQAAHRCGQKYDAIYVYEHSRLVLCFIPYPSPIYCEHYMWWCHTPKPRRVAFPHQPPSANIFTRVRFIFVAQYMEHFFLLLFARVHSNCRERCLLCIDTSFRTTFCWTIIVVMH